MNSKSFLLLLLIGLVTTSCTQTTETTAEDATVQDTDTLETLGIANLKLPALIVNAQPIVDDWSIFDDLESELVAVNSLPMADVRSRMERLITFSDSLGKTIPDTLLVQPVRSRLLIVKTRIKLLEQAVQSARPSKEKIKTRFEGMNEAWGFLKIQINEKLLKDAIDRQRKDDEQAELEKQRAKLDSIAAAEAPDN
ncbi:MAG: hypothetical protein ABJM06_09920 [Gilvibacter sp.]